MKNLLLVTISLSIFTNTLCANEKFENEKRKQLIIDRLSTSLFQTKDMHKKKIVKVTIECVKSSKNINDIKSCMSNTLSNKI